MFVLAIEISNVTALLPLVIGILGLGGLIFTALKYNRDDTTAVIGQQNTILDNMKALNEETRSTLEELRKERDEAKAEVERLRGEVGELRKQVEDLKTELRVANAALTGQVSRIERKLENDG